MNPGVRSLLLAMTLSIFVGLSLAGMSQAAELPDDGNAEWRLEQPKTPEGPTGAEGAGVPDPLGAVSDIEFESRNRGALITAGNGSSVKPGVWLYNGVEWVQLSTQCGATDRGASSSQAIGRGRIAWAGPDEFWTVSDGRPGQAEDSRGDPAPIEDNTLCHFTLGPGPVPHFVIGTSYASPAFESSSYQAMAGAACLDPSDCWFGGDELPEPQTGTFQLHWDGHSLTREPFLNEGHQLGDMAAFEGHVYASMRISESDPQPVKKEGAVGEVPAMHLLNPDGVTPSSEVLTEIPLLAPQEFPAAPDYLHLSADSNTLWAASGPQPTKPSNSAEAGVTVLRYSRTQYSREAGGYVEEATPGWYQVIGACPSISHSCEKEPPSEDPLPKAVVKSIAAEPGGESAWLALDSQENADSSNGDSPTAPAILARIQGDGTISDNLSLPGKGAAETIACPAAHDCWLATTQGWIYHLANQVERNTTDPNGDGAFAGGYLITERPLDEGVPQQTELGLPAEEETQAAGAPTEPLSVNPEVVSPFAMVDVPLLSGMHTRLVHGTTLELSFHLSVKARVRLIAKRRKTVVASTPARTLKAGKHSLQVRLNPKHWPTKLDLQTHALAPLRKVSTAGSSVESVSTSERMPGSQPSIEPTLGTGWPR